MPTGDSILGTHPLDVLNFVTSPEIATFGNSNVNAYIRLYDSNETSRGYFIGMSNAQFVIQRDLPSLQPTNVHIGSNASIDTGVYLLSSNLNAHLNISASTTTNGAPYHRIGPQHAFLNDNRPDLRIQGAVGNNTYTAPLDHLFLSANTHSLKVTSSNVECSRLVAVTDLQTPSAFMTSLSSCNLIGSNVTVVGDVTIRSATLSNVSASNVSIVTSMSADSVVARSTTTSNLYTVGGEAQFRTLATFSNNVVIDRSGAVGSGSTFTVRQAIGAGSLAEFYRGTSTTPTLLIANNGSVGIGTNPSSSYALDVNGNVNFTGSLNSNGAPFVSGFTDVTSSYATIGKNLGIGTIPSSSYALDVLGSVNFTGSLNQNGAPFVSGFSEVTSTYAVVNKNLGINQLPSANTLLDVSSPSGTSLMSMSNNGDLATSSATIGVPQTAYNVSRAIILDGNSAAPTAAITSLNITEDSSGNIYVCGEYFNTAAIRLKNLDGTNAATSFNLSALTAADKGSYVVKYNSVGAITGSATYRSVTGTTRVSQFTNVCVDSSDNLFVGGLWRDTTSGGTLIANLNGTNSTEKFPSADVPNIVVLRYATSTGTLSNRIFISGSSANAFTLCSIQVRGSILYILAESNIAENITVTTSLTLGSSSTTSISVNGLFVVRYNLTSGFTGYANVCTLPAAPRTPVTRGLAIDSTGIVYVSTTSQANTSFATQNISLTPASTSTLPSVATTYGFIIRYNTSGNVTGIARFGSSASAFGTTVDTNNNLYVCGTYGTGSSSIVNFDGTTTKTLRTYAATDTPCVLQFNSAGICTWVVTGSAGFVPRILAWTANNSLLVHGFTSSATTVSFDTARYGIALTSTVANRSAAIIQISSTGFVVSAVSFGSSAATYDNSCVLATTSSASSGSIYMTGRVSVTTGNTAALVNIRNNGTSATLTLPSTTGISSSYLVKFDVSLLTVPVTTRLNIQGDTLVNQGSLGVNVVPAAASIVDLASLTGTRLLQVDNTGNVVTIGDITAFGSLSDQRMKTNITSLTPSECIDKVVNLRPVAFNWNSNSVNSQFIGRKDVGLLAQELEHILPEAVVDKDIFDSPLGSIKTVRYERVIPLLIGAIKDLKETNTRLDQRIKDLEAKT